MSVIGGFGFSFLAQNVKIVMSIATIFSAGSIILFSLASAWGWTEDTDILQKYGWSKLTGQRSTFSFTLNGIPLTADGDFSQVQYIGLKGAFAIIDVSGNTTIEGFGIRFPPGTFPEVQKFVPYSDSSLCVTANCPYCDTAGLAVIRLEIIAIVLCFFVLLLSIARAVLIDSLRKKLAALSLSFIAIALSVAAFSTWHISCILKSKDTAALSHTHFDDQIGYSATAGGFVIMGIVMVLHLITPLRTDKSHLDVQALASPLFGHDGGFQRSDKATDFGIAGATELSVKTSSSNADQA